MNPIEQEIGGVMAAFRRGPEYGHAKLFYALNRIYRKGFEDAYLSMEPEWRGALDKWEAAEGDKERLSQALERMEELCCTGGTTGLADDLRAVDDTSSRHPLREVNQCAVLSPGGGADYCTLQINHKGWHQCWREGKLHRSWRQKEPA